MDPPSGRRLKTAEDGLPPSFRATSNAFIAAAGSGINEELAVPRRRPSLPPPERQSEAATAEERLVQELRKQRERVDGEHERVLDRQVDRAGQVLKPLKLLLALGRGVELTR